jgi:hypothetical protein
MQVAVFKFYEILFMYASNHKMRKHYVETASPNEHHVRAKSILSCGVGFKLGFDFLSLQFGFFPLLFSHFQTELIHEGGWSAHYRLGDV